MPNPPVNPESNSYPLVRPQSAQVQISEIVKQLDFATKENVRLKSTIEDTNNFLEEKLREISDMQSESWTLHTLQDT